MFCKITIVLFGAAMISVGATNRSYGAAGAFSDDGNHVYLIGSKLPKGTALDIDLTNFSAKKLSLGVSAEVRAIVNAPGALLFVTEKSLYRLPLPGGKPGKICEAPTGCLFDDVACNRAQHGILLLCRTKDGRDWPAYYLREHPAPRSIDSRKLKQLLVGEWASPRHVYVYRANGKCGTEGGR